MTDWASMQAGYGSAANVPALLARAAVVGSDDQELWNELFGHLCHQGTVYSASYAALPALAQMSRQHDPSGYIAALQLAAAIIASDDGPEERAVVRLRYEREVAVLHAVATRNLPYLTDDLYFIYGMQALMAFEDGGVWQQNLHCLADGEASLQCSTCDEHLLMDLDNPVPQVKTFSDGTAMTVTPLEPPPSTIEGRLLAIARSNGRTAIATKLPYLFGVSTCPSCREPFEISQGFA